MKRSGFTMVELIFVIVILGVLASIAIPKLSATRDDAKISKALTELGMLKTDLSSYYTAHGTYTVPVIKDATNVVLYTAADCATQVTSLASGSTYYYCVPGTGGGKEDLMVITVNDTDGNLTMAQGSGTGNIARGASNTSIFKELLGTVKNGGASVSY